MWFIKNKDGQYYKAALRHSPGDWSPYKDGAIGYRTLEEAQQRARELKAFKAYVVVAHFSPEMMEDK